MTIESSLRDRAKKMRIAGVVYLFFGLTLGVLITLFIPMIFEQITKSLMDTAEGYVVRASTGGTQEGKTELERTRNDLGRYIVENSQLRNEINNRSKLIGAVAGAVFRGSVIFIGIYLISVLFQFSRYHFRSSTRLETTADMICISKDDLGKFKEFGEVFTTNAFIFSKNPTFNLLR